MTWDDYTEAGEVENLDHLKILMQGASGSGKSTMAAMFKKPFIGLTELHAIPTIKKANPGAVLYGRSKDDPGIKSAGDISDFVRAARSAAEHGCDAVILDSLTDAQRLITKHYTQNQGDKAGTVKTTQESWGLIINATIKICRNLRDIPGAHVMVTVLDQEMEGDWGTIHRPLISGRKLPGQVPQFFNLVGFAYKDRMPSGEIRHQVLFSGPSETYLLKTVPGLEPIEPPEPLYWAHKYFGHELDAATKKRVGQWLAAEEDKEE